MENKIIIRNCRTRSCSGCDRGKVIRYVIISDLTYVIEDSTLISGGVKRNGSFMVQSISLAAELLASKKVSFATDMIHNALWESICRKIIYLDESFFCGLDLSWFCQEKWYQKPFCSHDEMQKKLLNDGGVGFRRHHFHVKISLFKKVTSVWLCLLYM